MVTKLVRDNVCLRKVGVAATETFQLIPKTEVDVDLLVRRTVEGAGLRLCGAAAGIGVVVIEDQRCAAILSSRLLGEKGGPGSLHVIERPGDEFRWPVFSGRTGIGAVCRRPRSAGRDRAATCKIAPN